MQIATRRFVLRDLERADLAAFLSAVRLPACLRQSFRRRLERVHTI